MPTAEEVETALKILNGESVEKGDPGRNGIDHQIRKMIFRDSSSIK